MPKQVFFMVYLENERTPTYDVKAKESPRVFNRWMNFDQKIIKGFG